MFLLNARRSTQALLTIATLTAAFAGCGGADPRSPGVLSTFDVSDGAGPFQAPFPIAHRVRPDGSLRIADFPNPDDNPWLSQLVDALENDREGFGLNGGIWLPFDGAVDEGRLPADPVASTGADSPVFLVDVSPDSSRYGERVPIEVAFRAEAGLYSPPNLLVVLPYQGVVLERDTTYAVVVRRGLGDAEGKPLFPAEALDALLRGDAPAGPDGAVLAAAFGSLARWLDEEGIAPTDVAAATIFTTGDPLDEMIAWQQQVAASRAPAVTDASLENDYDHFCVIRARTSLPVFQRGPKPYFESDEGHLVVDGAGALVEQERDSLDLVFTLPKTTMPDDGFPLVIYTPDAEGGRRQLVDTSATDEEGTGPALYYGARGIGALGYSAPLTGERHPDGSGDGTAFWNTANLAAFRGTLRQGILDVTTLVRIAQGVTFDASLCPDASSASGTLRYDPNAVVIHGHGAGGVIGGVALALEDAANAAVLSGLGGSWIYGVSLAEPRPGAGIPGLSKQVRGWLADDRPDRFDPVLTLLQTALESVEVMSWGRVTTTAPLPGRDPRHLLLVQGIPDEDHVPRMVDAYAMSVGLDLIAPEVDADALDDYALVGRGLLSPPAKGNIDLPGGDVTAATIQHAPNGSDGHDVAFGLDEVKYRYAGFVETLVTRGLPTVPGVSDDPFVSCP